MDKVEVIARRVLGWKLSGQNKWFDYENNRFIFDFQPEKNQEHADLIVKRLELFGFTFRKKNDTEVCFDEFCNSGNTLPEAIVNVAYFLAENTPIHEDWF